MTMWPVLLAGALVGAGIVVVVAGLVPPAPNLHAALTRLDTHASSSSPQLPMPASRVPVVVRTRLLPQLVESLGLRRYTADLRLVGQSAEDLAVRKVGYAVLGLAFPTVLTAGVAAMGVRPPAAVPLLIALVLAAALFLVPDVELRRRARAARASMRQATCAYLELVALERAADAGTSEALDRAASVGTTGEFDRLRQALLRAELAGQPSWQGLADLAHTTGVPELGDLADIMRLAGQDGAAVYATLRARAASLRTQMLATRTAQANAASEHMVVPVALLGVAFMALVGYPAFVRILYG